MFKPTGDRVMVELVEKDVYEGLVLPDSAKNNGKVHDLVVFAIGDDVTKYEVGDRVMTSLPKNGQICQFDPDGNGNRAFIVWPEEDIFGKFI